MNPYNDNVPYDYPMPYNGVGPTPPIDHGGGQPGGGRRKKKNSNDIAVILGVLDTLFDDE
jgi:hypothetical protein